MTPENGMLIFLVLVILFAAFGRSLACLGIVLLIAAALFWIVVHFFIYILFITFIIAIILFIAVMTAK